MAKKVVLALGMLGFLAAAGIAFAQTASTTTSSSVQIITPKEPMVLQINASGHALLRGTVTSVSGNTITVQSWGGIWTVNTASAKVFPASNGTTTIQQGDVVGIIGVVNQTNNLTINASLVRDWTQRIDLHQERQQNMQSVHQQERLMMPHTYQGTVSNLSGNSFTLTTADGNTYSVSLTSDAKIIQQNWLTLDLSKVQNGDTVRVWGPESSSTITASVFRDISIH